MLNLLIQLRLMNLLFHQYHNVVARVAFGSDHELFGEWYSALDDNYDAVAERLIGLSDSSQLNLHTIMDAVNMKCKQYPIDAKENATLFQAALTCEKELQQILNQLIKGGISEGTRDLLAGMANESEVRIYKQKQRLKK